MCAARMWEWSDGLLELLFRERERQRRTEGSVVAVFPRRHRTCHVRVRVCEWVWSKQTERRMRS